MGAIPTTTVNKVLDHLTLETSYTPTGPLKLRLMTANGSAASAGTEVTGGSYTPKTVTFAAASSGSAATDADITFTNLPAATITGVEIWDSAGTPVRQWWGALAASRAVSAGDDLKFPTGSIIVTIA